MKIYKIAQYVQEFPNEIPKVESEAIRLKDGRIFFTQRINHWIIFNYLQGRNIGVDQIDAIGWLDADGSFLSKARGASEIAAYMKNGNWPE